MSTDVLTTVIESLEKAKLPMRSNSLAYLPKNKKTLSGRDAQVAIQLADALDDHDDVQNVFADFELSDEELAALEE